MYDISQNPFYLYSVHRTSVSCERFRASDPLVSFSDKMFPTLSDRNSRISNRCSLLPRKALIEAKCLLFGEEQLTTK